MKFKNSHNLALALIGGCILTYSPAPAHAIGIGNALVFACTGDSAAGDAFLDEAIADCGAVVGNKSACQVLSGSPWACNNYTILGEPNLLCSDSSATVNINGGIAAPAGWSISANTTATMTIQGVMKNRRTCKLWPKNATGNEGKYVTESGRILAFAKFKLGGGITITNTVTGLSFTFNANATCRGSKSKNAYMEGETAACEEVKVKDPDKYEGPITPRDERQYDRDR